MITPFLDAGYWFIDAGHNEQHRDKDHKTVFAHEWEVNISGGTTRMLKTRKRRKKGGARRFKQSSKSGHTD